MFKGVNMQNGRSRGSIIVAILVFLVVALLVYGQHIFVGLPEFGDFIDTKNENTSPLEDESKVAAVNVKMHVGDKNLSHTVNQISFENRQQETDVVISLSAPTRYGTKRSMDRKDFKVTLFDSHLKDSFNKHKVGKSQIISGLNTIQDGDNLIIDLDISEKSTIKQVNFDEGKNAIILTLHDETVVVNDSNSQMIKTEAKPSESQLAEAAYQTALDAANQGDFSEALNWSEKALKKNKMYHDARKLFILSAYQLNKVHQGRVALEEGLQLAPNYGPYIKIKARLLVQEDKSDYALKLLEGASPSLNQDPEHFAFMAALYQEKGEHDKSIQLYKELLKLNPYNSIWWAGLAVSIDAKGHDEEALLAFEKASELGGLDLALREHVDARIHDLKIN